MMHSGWCASTLKLSLVLALASCSAPERPAQTAVIASGADLESANPLVTVHPLSRQVQRHALFVTLVKLDSTLQPVPYFARSWNWDAAHINLTFVLQRNLLWHDGVPTTARDVAFTYNTVRDRQLGAPRAGDLVAVTDVRATSDSTVVFSFNAAQVSMTVVFAELPLVPAHILDTVPLARWRTHDFSINPVGNGPFKFAERVAGRRWRFVRNNEFPIAMGGPPKLAQFVVAVVDEASTKFAGLVSGELDMAGVSPSMAKLVAGDSTLRLATPPVLFSTMIAFNTTRAPWSDVRVRRAIALSLNRRRLVDAAVAGYATPAYGAIPPGVPFAEHVPAEYNVTRADSLLDAAGWTRGENRWRRQGTTALRMRLITVGSGDMAAEQLIQADLRERGIQVDLQVRELATFLGMVRAEKKDFDAAYAGVSGDLALGHIQAMFNSRQRGGALDYTGFHTPLLDEVLNRARTAVPGAAATAAWQAVDSVLVHDSPAAWIYDARGVQGLSRKLQHVTLDLRGELTSIAAWTRNDSTMQMREQR
ncbi:MAG: peptide ABC transporter substrate-binding protein [Gemmatimonadota bacterium]|nr:peptide ABC transporter substrate-binding protein [Gemmatimonadota bacterium]